MDTHSLWKYCILMISVKRQERCTNDDDELNDNEKKARCKKIDKQKDLSHYIHSAKS